MYNLYGIWIDHAHAVILKANKMGEMTLMYFNSAVEPHIHGTADSNEHLSIVNQGKQEERRHNEMKAFSRELLKHVEDADELVIFGPGTAKHELHHQLEEHKVLAEKLKGIETAHELSEAELKDFMMTFFKLPRD